MSENQGMKWYVLRAVSGKEAKVKEYIENAAKLNDTLAANVGQVLLPTEKQAALQACYQGETFPPWLCAG